MNKDNSEKIDMFCHLLPAKYKEAILAKTPKTSYYYEANSIRPALWNLDIRFRVMDRIEGLREVLSAGVPPVEYVASTKEAIDMARTCNDEMAELVNKYPERFLAAVACLPLNDVDASLRETERAIKDLKFKGIQVFTSVNGKPLNSPEFLPLYEMMAGHDLPIWIHPVKDRHFPDYPGDSMSEYGLFLAFSWPYETTLAMGRLVFSGILERFPNLKFITHHCGGMLPSFYKRVALIPPGVKTGDVKELTKSPVEYFQKFYADTVMGGNTAALMAGYAFFGADHMLFASDYPYPGGAANSDVALEGVIKSVEAMKITDEEKAKIFSGNARRLLKLS
jgi:predicted TIM-barrel fold metal-dependent hydrolase